MSHSVRRFSGNSVPGTFLKTFLQETQDICRRQDWCHNDALLGLELMALFNYMNKQDSKATLAGTKI